MGLLSNTVSICQFKVVGELPDTVRPEWAGEQLARRGFRSIDETSEELSVGWVHLDDYKQSSFDIADTFLRDHYLAFSLRRDQRRIPASLVKAGLKEAEAEFLAANPGFQKVPKARKEEMRENVRSSLLARTLPIPSTWDAVWDTRKGILTFSTFSAKVVELFEELFKTTFEGLRLVAVHPYARAQGVVPSPLAPALEKANRASTETVLDLIRDNAWLGGDFLCWMMFRTMNEDSRYAVNQDGPAVEGELFTAYLNDRLILLGGSEDGGLQKVTVAGPQDRFREVCTALEGGKEITEATIYLEKGEDLWKMTLKGGTFHFGGLKSPGVKLEKDDLVDEAMERQAVFFERMHFLETALQLFDSLFSVFLQERLGQEWSAREQAIRQWLQAA